MDNQQNSVPVQENKMGTMSIGKLVFNMSLPMMVSMLVQALYNIVDSIFVAKLSENALTAVSLAFPLQTLLIAVGTGTGVGMNALLSKSLGEKNFKKANKTATNAAFIYAFSYIVFLILGFTIVKPFYRSQVGSADAEIMTMGVDYLSTVMIFSFGIFTQVFFERLLTSTGRTIFSMTSQLSGALTNIILDPILIFGMFGFPKMGVTGAAVATVIGQCVAGIVAGTCNHKFNHEVKFEFKGFRPDLKIIGTIYAVGIPSIIMQSIGSIMTYCMNRILIEFSSTATAVFGVYFKLQSFFFMPVFGLNNGITPIIAYNYGARQRKRMTKTIKLSLFVAFCLTFIGFVLFESIPQVLLGMFSASDDLLKIGIPALRTIGVHYLIAWYCIIVGTVFQALGKAIFSMVVSIMRQLVVLIPAAYLLAKFGGLYMVWWSFPIAEIMSFIVSTAFLIRIWRTVIKDIPEGHE
ncbi:MATE family efflux transporter [Butyribacter sp.]|uniref:MATE family efflux transporter n=1 Tax=Butyribacter sp. TaxID=2822465 RepID=UPI002A9390EA|nr:MATE family efflux transporter [Butyribacter sp.]